MTRKYTRRKVLVWPSAKNAARYQDMAEKYRTGLTLEQIGQYYGVTRERVRQIISRLGVTHADGGVRVRSSKKSAQKSLARDLRYLASKGCTFSQYLSIPREAKLAFIQQRRNAHFRKIEWKFNLWDWWQFWLTSGKWEQRGRGRGYCMCRMKDSGPYAVGNVYITTGDQNMKDYYRLRFNKDERAAA